MDTTEQAGAWGDQPPTTGSSSRLFDPSTLSGLPSTVSLAIPAAETGAHETLCAAVERVCETFPFDGTVTHLRAAYTAYLDGIYPDGPLD